MSENLQSDINETLKGIFFKELNLGFLEEEAQQIMLSEIGSAVLGNVASAVFLRLSDEQKNEFKKVFEQNDDNLKYEFFKKNVPDFDEIFIEEAKKATSKLGDTLK